jgi:hypothetical protein
MLKRIALLGAMAALTIWNPSNAAAQGWEGGAGGWGGVTVTVTGFPGPFQHRRPVRCCERPFIPRPVFCCERPFIPRPVSCCERPFIPRPVSCCERPFIPRPVSCCERRFFPRPFDRPPYFYGDNFAPYGYNWNAGYTDAGYGYDEY